MFGWPCGTLSLWIDILLAQRDRWLAVLIRSSSALLHLLAATLASVGVVARLRHRLLVDRTRYIVLVGLLWLGTLVLGILPHGLSGARVPSLLPRRLMCRFRFVHGLPLLSNLPTGRLCITPRPLRIPSSGSGALFGPLVDRTGRIRPHSLPESVLPQPRRLMRGLSLRSNLPTGRLRSRPLIRGGPPVGRLVGRTRCRTPGYRLLLRHACPLVGCWRPRRIVARRPLRSRGTTRLRRLGGWFRLRFFPDA